MRADETASSNEEMQPTERGLLVGAPADDVRCRPAIFTESRSAADLRCSADQGPGAGSEEVVRTRRLIGACVGRRRGRLR
jgi:hypothetical protein